MKTRNIRHMFAGATVAAATLLGTQAKASPIYLTANLTSMNTTAEVDDGINYQPSAKATVYFTLETDTAARGITAGNSGYAVISTPTGPVTVVDSNVLFTSGTGSWDSVIAMGGDKLFLQADTISTPGVGIGAGPAVYEQFANNYVTYGPKEPGANYALTSLNSPAFHIDSLVVNTPEPTSLVLGMAGAGMFIMRRRRVALPEVAL